MNKVFGLNIHSIGAFRATLGMTLLYDLIFNKIIPYKALFGKNGLLNNQVLFDSQLYGETLFGRIKTSQEMPYLLGAALIIYIFFAIGYGSKRVQYLTLFLFAYVSHKYYMFTNGADQIITVILVFAVFLPLDHRFSVHKSKQKLANEITGLPALGILLQIGVIYFVNGIHKLGSNWAEGYAIIIAASDSITARYIEPFFFQQEAIFKILNYFTLFYEVGFLFFLFLSFKNEWLRLLLAFSLMCFHLGIYLVMDIGYFHWIYTSIGLLLLPSLFWKKLGYEVSSEPDEFSEVYVIKNKSHYSLLTLIALMCTTNIFQVLQIFTFIDSNAIKTLSQPLKWIEGTPAWVPFLGDQSWKLYAPNPPQNLGIITIEGVDSLGVITNLSEKNPFSPLYPRYRTSLIPTIKFVDSRLRHYFDLMQEQRYQPSPKFEEFKNIWKCYQQNRLMKIKEQHHFQAIEVVFYSCPTKKFIAEKKLSFKKIKLFDLYDDKPPF